MSQSAEEQIIQRLSTAQEHKRLDELIRCAKAICKLPLSEFSKDRKRLSDAFTKTAEALEMRLDDCVMRAMYHLHKLEQAHSANVVAFMPAAASGNGHAVPARRKLTPREVSRFHCGND